MSIPLHPQHGLNAMVTVCFFCLQEKNEVACLGAGYRERAPNRGLLRGDRTPCDECAKLMQLGVLCLHVEGETPEEDVPHYSGMKVVVREALIRRMLKPETAERICKQRYVLMGDSTWDLMGLPREEVPGVPTTMEEFQTRHAEATRSTDVT